VLATSTLGLPCRRWACPVDVGLAASTLGLPRRRWTCPVNVGLAASMLGLPRRLGTVVGVRVRIHGGRCVHGCHCFGCVHVRGGHRGPGRGSHAACCINVGRTSRVSHDMGLPSHSIPLCTRHPSTSLNVCLHPSLEGRGMPCCWH